MSADQPEGAYKLWQRAANGEGFNWAQIDSAETTNPGIDGSALFINFTTNFGQFILTMPADSLVSGVENPNIFSEKTPEVRVYPNAVASGGKVSIFTENLPGALVFRLFDAKGNPVQVLKFESQTTFEVGDLAAGAYFYRVEAEKWMSVGKLIIGQ